MASRPLHGAPMTLARLTDNPVDNVTFGDVAGLHKAPTVGAQFHGMWSSYNDNQRMAVLDTLRAVGIRTVRLDVSWAMVQPSAPTDFDPWGVGFVDRVIGMCVSRGIHPLVTFWLTPGWANGGRGERVLPDDPHDYARALRWLAHRHRGRVLGWEIWNEPNSADFLAGASAAEYTQLLGTAYPACRAGDPRAVVVFGGVQYNDDSWIRDAYDAGAQGCFDVMATHPYPAVANSAPRAEDDGTTWAFTHAAAVHRLMVAHGDGDKPIWFTELGWSTHSNPAGTPNHALGVTEATQARYFADAVDLIRTSMPYVTHVYWYAERDSAAHAGVHNQNFGLLRADHSAKPILTTVMAYTSNSAIKVSGQRSSGTGRRSPA